MASLNIKSFATLVSDQVTAIQAKSNTLLDFSIGSILRSFVEGSSGVVLWIQQLIVTLLVTIRASTSSGVDLDTWFADFGFARNSASAATGQVTFSRFTATSSALIPVGSQVTTADGTQTYNVIASTTNSFYDAAQNGYVIPSGISSATVPVQAATAGAAGNADIGTVTIIVGSIPGVDTVSNSSAFAGGADAESDDDARQRFQDWIASLSKSTKNAIGYAISQVQSGITYSLTENYDYNGDPHPGFFYAVVDDGSGNPSDDFIASVYNAVDIVRGFTVSFAVFKPSTISADVTLTLTLSTTDTAIIASVKTLVHDAIDNYISALGMGVILPYSKISQLAYGASSYVTNVSSITLNGGTSDLIATSKQVIRTGTITVN
ncbi:baseplate J/gp47 family protein [Klebsiella variicola]|uniref:baseplate J/gp47 family protein n=1 Tax=Klebsiella variicola TaxID=244366 RepID=UPI0011EEF85F|nr:baseplate J/gp47 family protein [Klebsiella variicola]KAA0473422.1 baseplate protein [Klebsiella variicola]